jgi:hypothetical protein
MDGTYGFEERMDTDDHKDNYENGGGLYSDNLVGNRGRGRGNIRDRGNERGRGFR